MNTQRQDIFTGKVIDAVYTLNQVSNLSCFSVKFFVNFVRLKILYTPNSMKNLFTLLLIFVFHVGVWSYAMAQTAVEGTVMDILGHPVKGVSVKIKGTSNGTTTSDDGTFALTSSRKSGKLIFLAPGFERVTYIYANETKIDVVLNADHTSDKIVTNGYASKKSSDMTGSSSSVDSKSLATGSGDVRGQLQGRFPGVMVSTTGGVFKVRIRGVNSFNSPTEPLYVVDNVPMSDVSTLNPDNIQRIDVLKDAAETSIYGTRGANGVIVITTKH